MHVIAPVCLCACACACSKLSSLCAAGQTSEGVLANFFNSLLTKKAGSGGPGTPGGGNNTPGTVRKSGENAHEVLEALLDHSTLINPITF